MSGNYALNGKVYDSTGNEIGWREEDGTDRLYVTADASGNQTAGGVQVGLTLPEVLAVRNSTARRVQRAIGYSEKALSTSAPWNAAPAYAASTAYKIGDVVQNSGNLYLARTAGTSGASSAPTSTVPNVYIVDGTVTWAYMGTAQSAAANAPTLTNPGSIPASLSVQKTVYADSSWVHVSTSAYVMDSAAPTGIWWSQTTEPINTQGIQIEFMTDSTDLIILMAYGQVPVRIGVDGVWIAPGCITSSASYNLFELQIPGGRKPRKITVMWQGSHHFVGVAIAPTDAVWAPAYPSEYKLHVVGDSFVSGSSNHGLLQGNTIAFHLASLLAGSKWSSDGVGGSGYLAAGSGVSAYNALRIARIPTDTDILVVLLGINDTNDGTFAPGVAAYLNAVRARLPNTLIYACGAWAGCTGPDTNVLTKESAIKSSVLSAADPMTVFVPISSGPTPVVWGTGKGGATAANGNSDWITSPDNTHPAEYPLLYLATRVAAGIISDIKSRV